MGGLPIDQVFVPIQQHPELGTPIAEMIVGDYFVAQEPQQSCQAVADDGAAEVADVHLLGDVGAGIIDDHALGMRGLVDPQPRIGRDGPELSGQPGG